MPAYRIIDQIQELADVDPSLLVDGRYARWDSTIGRLVGVESTNADLTYIHLQNSASSVWTINHNLSKFPSISIVDSAGSLIVGAVNYVDENTAIVSFFGSGIPIAFSGKAFCN